MTIRSLLQGGFQLVRERPGAMLIWTLIQLVTGIATSYAMAAILGGSADALAENAAMDPQMMSLQSAYLMQMGGLTLAGIIVSSVVYAAILRAVLRPSEGGPGWLRLGMDEARLFLLVLVYLLGFGLAFVMLALFLGALFGSSETALSSLALILTLIAVVGAAYFGTRLALTFPLTLKIQRYAIDEGWHLTKGRFWPLFTTFFIIFLIMLAMAVLTMAATEPDYLSAVFRYGFTSAEADAASMRSYELLRSGSINVQIVVAWLFGAIQGAITYALFGGAAATAVQQLTADEEGLRETFS